MAVSVSDRLQFSTFTLITSVLALPANAAEVTQQVIESNIQSEAATFDLVQVVSGLEHPWAVDWLPDGRMLVTERPGRLHLIDGDQAIEVSNLPQVHSREDNGEQGPEAGQGGLLDVAVHPRYQENGWIYFTYSSPGDPDAVYGDAEYGTGTALFRARLSENGSELIDNETLYVQVPRTDPGRHYGSRIVFPEEGFVMFTIGDRGQRRPSQDLTDPGGSVIRLLEDGGAPEDNPFVEQGQGNLRPEIYAFGVRNIQGMTLNREYGEIWALDHGPRGGDLLVRVEAGDNLGWPQVTHGVEYSTGEPSGIGRRAPGVRPPIHVWEDSMAPSGLAYYDGDVFPDWQGNLFAGSLGFEQLHRLVMSGGEVEQEEILLTGTIGRIRDVNQGPDGMLYVVTDEEDGGVYVLRPSN